MKEEFTVTNDLLINIGCRKEMKMSDGDIGFAALGNKYIGPVLVAYVRWILNTSVQLGISRIYFLARDGWILKEIAEKICEKFSLPVECRYLYCSRYSLRIPTYGFIGEEAFDSIFSPALSNTIHKVFERAGVDTADEQYILSHINPRFDPDEKLNKADYDKVCSALRDNALFKEAVQRKAEESYCQTIGYLKQEGLFSQTKYAIADSGWTGSMQRSLRQLLEHEGYNERLIGFYFGMYSKPKDECDGDYYQFYFSSEKNVLKKTFFCNNLLECWLTAPHAMTIGYEKKGTEYLPIFACDGVGENNKIVSQQAEAIMKYLDSLSNDKLDPDKLVYNKCIRKVYHILKHIMAFPTKNEARIFGQYHFNDDVTCDLPSLMASPEQVRLLKNYSIPRRLLCKLFRRLNRPATFLYWPYGTASLAPWYQKWWFRLNITMWEMLRAVLM